jgi:hypothetical protein
MVECAICHCKSACLRAAVVFLFRNIQAAFGLIPVARNRNQPQHVDEGMNRETSSHCADQTFAPARQERLAIDPAQRAHCHQSSNDRRPETRSPLMRYLQNFNFGAVWCGLVRFGAHFRKRKGKQMVKLTTPTCRNPASLTSQAWCENVFPMFENFSHTDFIPILDRFRGRGASVRIANHNSGKEKVNKW